METNTYVIPEDRREEVEKLIQKYQRKAERYGIPLEISMGKPYATEVNYWGEDPCSGLQSIVHTDLVEAFDLTISGGIIRNGNYSVIAMLEHLDGGNVVTTFGNDIKVKDSWRHANCHCDHCGINRYRRLTFIVSDGNDEKQVGKTCLKDYCGIDPDGIGIANELRDVFLNYDINEVREYDPDCPVISRAYDALEVLALAIRVCKKQKYVKSEYENGNKWKMLNSYNMFHELIDPITPEERTMADSMANGIGDIPEDDLYNKCYVLANVKALLEAGYCKASHFGYMAYAPIDYAKYIEMVEEQRQREAEAEAARKSSNYIGEIGKRITIDVMEAKYITSWETMYGMTHLYKFLDADGNVFVWFASSMIDEAEVKSLKGTVKDHTERNGIKQTVLTRCKVA